MDVGSRSNTMLDTQPRFSVVMPLFNKACFVVRAVESVLNQTCQNFELVIVDDGSTDDSVATVEREFRDPRIHIISQSNQGQGAARNGGIRESRGTWIAFLDADDGWAPSHLAELDRVARLFPEAGLIATGSLRKDAGDDLSVPADQGKVKLVDYFRFAASDIGFVNSSTAAIIREGFEQVGLFGDYPAGQDLEMWARVSLCYPCAVSTKCTAVYFQGTGGVMDSLAAKTLRPFTRPGSLFELSPSVAMLSGKLTSIDSHSALYASVLVYIDGRLESAVRAAFVRGEIARMKHLRRLYVSPWTPLVGSWRHLSALPRPLMSSASYGRRIAKKAYQWIKN